ncbi:adenosine deaminase-like isoform X1 [Penaeus japonicus]|uniref:adenosine deaminase-like isoform X1 n=1 Tax=Penaeus japonicus TaxID=27405 RepID=UPI001C716630|nr:adenosine deaminase-like isoform X1 [Penaeus japonicus]
MFALHEPLKHKPKCRVQLHIHLDGAIRHETIWELLRKKKLPLPGSGSLEDLKNALKVQEPQDLCFFLHGFTIFMPAFVGDLEAIERISHEFVEDQAKESVAYCETRFCPHLFLPDSAHQPDYLTSEVNGTAEGNGGNVTIDDVLKAVLKGLKRGEEEFGTKVRVILCCIRGLSHLSREILRLCEEYQDKGVVGIDIAGNEGLQGGEDAGMQNAVDIAVFQAAKEKGIHRTVHAGEAGPAKGVQEAVESFSAERIGHGYRVLEDENIYQKCIRENIHFEVCPHSSYMTGAIKSLTTSSKRHPVLRFAEDEVSFSISTDDPTITFTTLPDEYRLLSQWGFTEAHFTRANFQAALHSFLPPEEKKALIDQLHEAYSFIDYKVPSLPTSSPPTTRSPTPPLKPSITFGTWAERS